MFINYLQYETIIIRKWIKHEILTWWRPLLSVQGLPKAFSKWGAINNNAFWDLCKTLYQWAIKNNYHSALQYKTDNTDSKVNDKLDCGTEKLAQKGLFGCALQQHHRTTLTLFHPASFRPLFYPGGSYWPPPIISLIWQVTVMKFGTVTKHGANFSKPLKKVVKIYAN